MRLRRGLVAVTAVAFTLAAGATPAGAEGNGGTGNGGGRPDANVEGTLPGGPGGQSSNQDATGIGCPPGGEPAWQPATPQQVAEGRAHGQLFADDERNAVLFPQFQWWVCQSTNGPLFDYPVPPGAPPIDFDDLIPKPVIKLNPTPDHLVVGVPTRLTLERGGIQTLHMPAAAGEFRAVPQRVVWKTGVGDDAVVCLDARAHPPARTDLTPPANPRAPWPTDACTTVYARPSTAKNAGDDQRYKVVVEVTYRIETRPTGGTDAQWQLFAGDPVGLQVTNPVAVAVHELQAVAD